MHRVPSLFASPVVAATPTVGGTFGSHPKSPQRCPLCPKHPILPSVGDKVEHLRKTHGAMVWREDGLMHYSVQAPA